MGESTEQTEVAAAEAVSGGHWKRRFVVGLIVVVAFAVAWFFGAQIIPRWWARRIGDLIGGRLTFGSFLGISMGVVFTMLPLLALRAGWRFRAGWKRWIKFVLFALVLAAPNLATAGIVYGNGSAAHAGERILDVDGPGFRGGTLVGAVLGAALTLGLVLLFRSRRRNKDKVAGLKAELESRDQQ